MSSEGKKIKVLLAKLGLEVHWRGVVTVAGMLRDAGMEVIYVGNAFPQQIAEAAIQEDVDVVGVSTLGGNHLPLGGELLEIARQRGIKDSLVFLIGGVFPPYDVPKLKELGFDAVFGPGTTQQEITDFIEKAVAARKGS
jgi:methylmalonyl-CoA mutase C-terminal domain/subunit